MSCLVLMVALFLFLVRLDFEFGGSFKSETKQDFFSSIYENSGHSFNESNQNS